MNQKTSTALAILQGAANTAEQNGCLKEMLILMKVMRGPDDGKLVEDGAYNDPVRGLIFTTKQSTSLGLNGARSIDRQISKVPNISHAFNMSQDYSGHYYEKAIIQAYRLLGRV